MVKLVHLTGGDTAGVAPGVYLGPTALDIYLYSSDGGLIYQNHYPNYSESKGAFDWDGWPLAYNQQTGQWDTRLYIGQVDPDNNYTVTNIVRRYNQNLWMA